MKQAEAQEGPHSESLEFDLPEGVDGEPGEEKDVVCTVRILGTGKGALVAVEGNPIGEKSLSTEDEPDGDEGSTIEDRFAKFRDQSQGQQQTM